jgi:hypothetical protein
MLSMLNLPCPSMIDHGVDSGWSPEGVVDHCSLRMETRSNAWRDLISILRTPAAVAIPGLAPVRTRLNFLLRRH